MEPTRKMVTTYPSPLDVARHYVAHTVSSRRFRAFVVMLALVLIARTISSFDLVHLPRAFQPSRRFVRSLLNRRLRVPTVANRSSFTVMQHTPSGRIPSQDAGVAHVLPINAFDSDERVWKSIQSTDELGVRTEPRSNFALITWNVDFSSPEPENRIDAALSYLRSLLVSGIDTISPAIIVFQEINHSMVKSIAENEWVQRNFFVTDVSTDAGVWTKSHYGTLTLVDRRMPVKTVLRLHYDSDFNRDCLFVDVEAASAHTSQTVTVRVGNTHLESLVPPTPLRVNQMKQAGRLVLHDSNVYTGLIAGDMNPIDPFDSYLPVEVGLKDAYLEGGGQDEDPRGHTWGYQSGDGEQQPYPKRRFDKILYPPGDRMTVEQVAVIGAGQKTTKQPEVFISDHFGVWGNIRIW
ncbi:hypothetical protein Dda_0786 [Drechslerella dactyloides]|uniref:Endonuclease/exonuclease/phosphatase domain-containing protein n=1 Tax=Drechslerella dactyloides TaxID=74499 RepID=A0AAD6NNA8_DREDA|nr:hypothetical protein Dda_0786 [Drechslerella dactyloides]